MSTAPFPADIAPSTAFRHAEGKASVAAYKAHCDTGPLSSETAATYLKCVGQFLAWWEEESGPLAQEPLSNPVAVAYAEFLLALEKAKKITKGRRAVRLSSVRRWGTFLVSAGLLTANPFQTVGGLPRADILPACLSEEAVRSRLAAMPKTKLIEHRDYVIALLMLRTGIRETELCEVSVADVLPVGDVAFIQVRSKGKQKRENHRESVVLRPDVYAELQEYLARRTAEEGQVLAASAPLFSKDRQWMIRWQRKRPASEARLTPNEIRRRLKPYFNYRLMALRQTAAVHALMNGAPLDGVQEMMRHESIETTKLYKHIANRLQRGGERYLDHFSVRSEAAT